MTTVSNASELMAALSVAVGGDRIELIAGDYGRIDIRGVTFSSDVTIVSADPANPPTVRELYIRDVSHLVFDGIFLDFTFGPTAAVWERPFQILDSSHITIRNSIFDGSEVLDAAGNLSGTGFGLYVTGSSFITVEYNEFYNFWKGINVGQSADIFVSHNDVHTLRSDGFNFIGIDGLLVEGNWFHDFKMLPDSGDHLDMIQLWTVLGETSSQDVIIRGNFFDAGVGDLTQSIFIRNGIVDTGQGSFEDYAYQNILVVNNVIYNHHTHGITVGETDGVTVKNNTLLNDPHVRVVENISPRINLAESSLNVTVEGNILESMWNWPTMAALPGWSIVDNLFVQFDAPNDTNYYGNLFVSPFAVAATLADLRAVSGGVIEIGGYGASMTRADIPLLVGPYSAGPGLDPVTEPGVCEALLVEALVAAADLEAQLASMTAERDAASAALLAALKSESAALDDLETAQTQLAVAGAKLDAIRVILEG